MPKNSNLFFLMAHPVNFRLISPLNHVNQFPAINLLIHISYWFCFSEQTDIIGYDYHKHNNNMRETINNIQLGFDGTIQLFSNSLNNQVTQIWNLIPVPLLSNYVIWDKLYNFLSLSLMCVWQHWPFKVLGGLKGASSTMSRVSLQWLPSSLEQLMSPWFKCNWKIVLGHIIVFFYQTGLSILSSVLSLSHVVQARIGCFLESNNK